MLHQPTAVIAILSLVVLATMVWASACVDGEATPGAEVEVILEARASDDTTSPLQRLELVFDHVELLDCDGPSAGPLSALPSLIPEAQAAHLPEAPHRLLKASRWLVVDDGKPAPTEQVGTITPPLQDWCGLRFGFYSALPDTKAIDEGISEGVSLQGIWQMPDGEGEPFSGSIGFDIEYGDNHSPPLQAGELREAKMSVVLELDLDEALASIKGADDPANPPSPATIAQGLVDGASITVNDVPLHE